MPISPLATEPVILPRRARAATATAFAAQGLMFTVLLTHLPQFTHRYHLSTLTVTLIVFTVTVLAGVGSLLSELLAGATSSRTALRCGLLVVALSGGLIALAPGRALFVGGFALYGVGVGAVDAAGNMQAVAVQHRYGRSILTSFHAVWSGAAIVGALYVAEGERRALPLTTSILSAAVLVLLIALLAGPQLLPTKPLAEPVDVPVAPVLPVAVTRGPLLLLGLAMTCFWAVDSGVSNWSALYLRDLLKASDSTAALGFGYYQATALISRLGGDLAVRRFGAVATVRACAMVGTAGALIVVLAPGPAIAIVGFGLTGLGLPVIAPLCFGAAGAAVRSARGSQRERNPESAGDVDLVSHVSHVSHVSNVSEVTAAADAGLVTDVDRVVARLNVFNYVGSLLGAVLIGAVATAVNLRAGFVISVLLAVSVIFLARAFAPEQQHGQEPDE